ncbi:MAG: heavy-metal-associated domain-containing protein [Alphaproteobacteria bacterium]|nr:heavy-metal-associated domain-containing protein [Alphaproteobacteria bacterium]
MTCGGCVRSVTRALQALPGVSEVQVSLEDKAATVTLDPAVATRAQLVGAIEDAGFDVPS